MIARIESWQIKELGPAFHYGQEEPGGGHSYPAMTDVSFRVRVVGGDDAQEFLDSVRRMVKGDKLLSLTVEGAKRRKYDFK